MDFELNWRRQQEKRLRPYADAIYVQTWGLGIGIARFDKADAMVLDKEFAIDVRVELPCGLCLIGQEKLLSKRYAQFRTVTVEYMQDPRIEERGDWFKLAVQFYLTGYEDDDGLNPWVLLNWPNVVTATHQGLIKWRTGQNKSDGAKASFRYVNMEDLPGTCYIAASWD